MSWLASGQSDHSPSQIEYVFNRHMISPHRPHFVSDVLSACEGCPLLSTHQLLFEQKIKLKQEVGHLKEWNSADEGQFVCL